MNRPFRARVSRLAAALVGLAALESGAAPVRAEDPGFERTDGLRAGDYLTAEQMRGPHWQVADAVSNDGFANTYTITSRFGSWAARGAMQLDARIREIAALEELDRISKSSVFVDAVKRSAVGQVETVASFAAQPVETVKAIPGGVKRWFQKTSYQASEVYHDVKTKAAETSDGDAAEGGDSGLDADKAKELARREALDYLKITSAERRWYAELGVDPYTDNEVLRRAIRSYSRIEGLTSFGMKFVGLPSIPGVGAIRKTMTLVWETDPWELRRRNRKALLEAGISESTAREFEDQPWLTLTIQTSLVDSLEALAGVGGREHLIARALDIGSRDDGRLLVQAVSLLVRFHGEHEPLATVLPGVRLPVARTRSGELVATAPADAFFWTAEMAEAAADFAELYSAEPATARRLWLVGVASPRFKAESAKRGWEVRDLWRSRDLSAVAAASGRRGF
jgi:hypothetical protein